MVQVRDRKYWMHDITSYVKMYFLLVQLKPQKYILGKLSQVFRFWHRSNNLLNAKIPDRRPRHQTMLKNESRSSLLSRLTGFFQAISLHYFRLWHKDHIKKGLQLFLDTLDMILTIICLFTQTGSWLDTVLQLFDFLCAVQNTEKITALN